MNGLSAFFRAFVNWVLKLAVAVRSSEWLRRVSRQRAQRPELQRGAQKNASAAPQANISPPSLACGIAVLDLESLLCSHLPDVLGYLHAREASFALPATSRTSHSCVQRDALGVWVRLGALWPDAAGPALAPSLEYLFMHSMREDWGRSSAIPPCSVVAHGSAGEVAEGPVLTIVRHTEKRRAVRQVAWALRWGARVDDRDKNGWTALIWAAQTNRLDLSLALLGARANVDHIGRDGSSALSVACISEHTKLVGELLLAGASTRHVGMEHGNFRDHVGDEIMNMLRVKRRLETSIRAAHS